VKVWVWASPRGHPVSRLSPPTPLADQCLGSAVALPHPTPPCPLAGLDGSRVTTNALTSVKYGGEGEGADPTGPCSGPLYPPLGPPLLSPLSSAIDLKGCFPKATVSLPSFRGVGFPIRRATLDDEREGVLAYPRPETSGSLSILRSLEGQEHRTTPDCTRGDRPLSCSPTHTDRHQAGVFTR
jgi:hypothetical protein